MEHLAIHMAQLAVSGDTEAVNQLWRELQFYYDIPLPIYRNCQRAFILVNRNAALRR